MRLSKSFWQPLRECKADNLSHNLMLRADLISSMATGLYSWQPMGVRVLDKIITIVNKHMQAAGFEKMLMPVLQPAGLWEKSGRYEAYGKEMLRVKDRHDKELIYGPTAEECFTQAFDNSKLSYKRLPVKLYNIQWKFRDEIRPRFGVMRSREFLMKDGYSFDLDEAGARETYSQMFDTYMKIFNELELKVLPAVADAGVIGGSITHDFHVLASNGENNIYFDKKLYDIPVPTMADMEKYYSRTDDNHCVSGAGLSDDDSLNTCKSPAATELESSRAIEVGHIFLLGDKYTRSMGVTTQTDKGHINPIMGCYGIGITRLVAAIIEQSNDERGIIWPQIVAPFKYHLINLHAKDQGSTELCNKIYDPDLMFYDDLHGSVGAKLNHADLLGLPYQIIVSSKNLEQVELKNRKTGEKKYLNLDELRNFVTC